MKRKMFFTAAIIAVIVGATLASCSDDDKNNEEKYTFGTDGGLRSCDNILFGDVIGYGDQEFVFTGNQTIKKGTYTLKGWVYIAKGAQLTIEPGTVIKGDKQTKAALIVEPGGKLYAEGTADNPIVFTSAQPKGNRKPGDWGGVIICGRAKNNQGTQQIEGGPRTKHGGNDDADNSGVFRYVRIEFAGYPFETDKEINGLTFGSVGSSTQIDHIQVSYSNDDSYEWFGGTVNCKYLVAYKGWDDEFDTDNGFSGNVQFCLSVRDPKIADKSLSNGFESDNCADGAAVNPYTSCVFSNVTFIGPKAVSTDVENTESYITGGSLYPNNGSGLGKFQAAMQIRRASRLNCFNSVAIGYPVGLILDGEKGDTQTSATAGKLSLENIWMANMDAVGCDQNKGFADVFYDWATKTTDESRRSFSSQYFLAQTGNKYFDSTDSWLLEDTNGVGTPYMPRTGSPLLSAASFSNSRLGTWFARVSYIGAFANGDNWLNGWTNFDPQNTDY